MHFLLFLICFVSLVFSLSPPSSRTVPPSGAFVVRAGTTTSGEFASLAAAVSALPSDTSAQTIFIFPGTYQGQVNIQRNGPVTIFGYSDNPGSQASNTVILSASVDATTAGSDDASGTLRIHTDNVNIYNVNIRNDFGPGIQAIALSNYGNQVGLYACGLYGYQDTLYTNQGIHVYLQGYIEGAVDFIFGKLSQAYFEGNTIAIAGPGCITADGRQSDDAGIYLFNENTIELAPSPASGTSGNIFFGRPWRDIDWARVILKATTVTAPMNPALWSEWNAATPNTDHVTYADYQTTGPGIPSSVARPSFVSVLTAPEATQYTIASALGSDYTAWVDADYLL
ncbi:carbohydrate esterase family 8 protein [Amylostereum chailletii]|nr:carbohydrate esterase family 8 protein [Amylostereum chailletii]